MKTRRVSALWLSAFAFAQAVFAQAPGPAPEPAAPSQAPEVVVPEATQTAPVYVPFGVPAPGTDINAGLPSSSRPITGDQRDGFDLGQFSQGGTVVLGSSSGEAVIESESEQPIQVPDVHFVKRGDTLWDLSSHYYRNPWQWPNIWKFNSRIQNPHWIYPGDQVRLRNPNILSGAGGTRSLGSVRLGGGASASPGTRAALGPGREGAVPRETVFLRDQGFLGDPKRDVWGELVGAVEEQMLLSEGNHVYLLLKEDQQVSPGQELTVFRSVRPPGNVPGARKPPGEIVSVRGTVRIDRFDPKTRVARGEISESVDVIERGAKIGPVRRRFEVVPPVKNKSLVEARVLNSFYPHVYLGQNQVVFLDRGSQEGLVPGNTLVIFRKGDTWRKSLSTASPMMVDRLKMESPERVDVERTPIHGDPEKFPEEAVAELRIISTEKLSALALVTQSRREVVPGDRAVARPGY